MPRVNDYRLLDASSIPRELDDRQNKHAWFHAPLSAVRAHRLIFGMVVLAALGAAALGTAGNIQSGLSIMSRVPHGGGSSSALFLPHEKGKTGPYVIGPPGSQFRETLNPDLKYVSSWAFGGMTNVFMSDINLILLGLLSRRIPVIAPFTVHPTHVHGGGSPLEFGEIFDLPRLQSLIQWPVVEWSDIKKGNDTAAEHESLGCWAASRKGGGASPSTLEETWKLDIMWTSLPDFAWIDDHDYFLSLSGLAVLLQPSGYTEAFSKPDALEIYDPMGAFNESVNILPDEHLACFDFLYYAGLKLAWEAESQASPMWNLVGTYIHFNSRTDHISNSYLRRLFGVPSDEQIPPFVTIHIRHSDFSYQCAQDKPLDECYAPLSAYARRVEQIKADLAMMYPGSPKSRVTEVIVTSDESDAKWWAGVYDMGWKSIDHSRLKTSEIYGSWYPSVIDSVIQSRGAGFVGTRGSTMSMIAGFRVRDWNGGPVRMVKWGEPGADDN